jgi:hypothetical protein
MKKEIYRNITSTKDFQTFEFMSVGRKGVILKRIEFTPTKEPGVYSLVLGDVNKEGEPDLYIASDNGDRNKILATVMDVIDAYCGRFPDRWIHFRGSTSARTRLYRMAIGRDLDELSIKFDIYAKVNNKYLRFTKNMDVTAFLIKRKIT